MQVIKVRNVHQALPEACRQLRVRGVERDSRNGPVRMFPTPVVTAYSHPCERVLFWAERDANPFFHFFECLWMLGGRNDVHFISRFNSAMHQFSDDGETFNGAYGYRWRVHFDCDQLETIVQALQRDKNCRRQVLSMFDARRDLGLASRDIPCNTHAYVQVATDGRLDLTVMCRSNDLIWGCYGTNAVHFSFLLEWLAARIGVEPGTYYHVSVNLHAYWERHGELVEALAHHAPEPPRQHTCPYTSLHPEEHVDPYVLGPKEAETLGSELSMFLDEGPVMGLRSHVLRKVAGPLWAAWTEFKELDAPARFEKPVLTLQRCEAPDWRRACSEWILRRRDKWLTGKQRQS